MQGINALLGGIGTMTRSVVRAVDGVIKNKESFSFKRFGVSIIHAVVLGLGTGVFAPDPYSALLGGYLGGHALDSLGLNFKGEKKP